MLTSAENPREINRCSEYGCNSYITKSVDATALVAAVQESLP
jgi:DNA-binding NarL/FixJ family response regulator